MLMVTKTYKRSILLYLAPKTYRSWAREGAVLAKQMWEEPFIFNKENFFLQDRAALDTVNPFHSRPGRNNGSLRCPGPHITKAQRLVTNYQGHRLIVQWLLSTGWHPKLLLCRRSQIPTRQEIVAGRKNNNKQINVSNAHIVMSRLCGDF